MIFYLSVSEIGDKKDGTSLNRFEKNKLNKAKIFPFFFFFFLPFLIILTEPLERHVQCESQRPQCLCSILHSHVEHLQK